MNQIVHKAVQLGLEEQLEYGMGGEVSTEGDVYSYGILLSEMFIGKRPTDSMFTDDLSLNNYAKMALPERVMDIVDPQIILEDKDESNMSSQSSKCNTARTNECHSRSAGSLSTAPKSKQTSVCLKLLVFSSSETVYGQPEKIPCIEDFQLMAMNPYGRTKLFLEEIARDIERADSEWRMILLRYFNPVGAHESGKLGEDPKGIPNNLMPYIQQVAVGRLPELNVYGHDYPTADGSAVRDYIHVMDLADGHIAALRKLFTTENIGCTAYNLGTGRGTSVLEMVATFEKASGKETPQLSTLLQRRLRKNLVGRQNMALKKCAGTNGSGQAKIHGDTSPSLEWHTFEHFARAILNPMDYVGVRTFY
ncbi:hypothetical protein F0562_011835 [Nyssa sinensis]|uniref:NAD-dependent epimerase/dehydratase domain-containing protein n=1 Tax=Nyssa sinensis TaxID=561372 RepID=A0A5J4ZRV7_9ASTE|nr:hypothetical protein F0562_011835 [Nyssa sinensis]